MNHRDSAKGMEDGAGENYTQMSSRMGYRINPKFEIKSHGDVAGNNSELI